MAEALHELITGAITVLSAVKWTYCRFKRYALLDYIQTDSGLQRNAFNFSVTQLMSESTYSTFSFADVVLFNADSAHISFSLHYLLNFNRNFEFPNVDFPYIFIGDYPLSVRFSTL
jgi:hypothetical protein